MPHYKDQDNQLHFIDNPEDAEKYLPAGCVEITDTEAEQIRQAAIVLPTQNEIIQSQIDALEKQTMLPRVTREFMLAQTVITAQMAGVDEPTLYTSNVGYRKVKDMDAQIAALRAQLTK